jgi:hypothetical protein
MLPGISSVATALVILALTNYFGSHGNLNAMSIDGDRSTTDRAPSARSHKLAEAFDRESDLQNLILHDGWRLLRTPHAEARSEQISVWHPADIQRSSPNLVGIVLRCGDKQIEVLIVVVEPYPPQKMVNLAVKFGDNSVFNFQASVLPPGIMVRLPSEAAGLIVRRERPASEMSLELVPDTGPQTSGVVLLNGLAQALAVLKQSCARI